MATEQADINTGRSISAIWFIPLLALALGAYMVVHTWMTEGPEIEITFNTASGLEQGKTKVKYRNVDVGLVESVRLDDDFDSVIATVKLDRQMLPLLREDTRFWVVTAQVGVGSITGLDTLLSGAYIQIAPGEGKTETRKFVALEKPPLTPTGAPGLRLKLTSKHTSSVGTGDSVVYQGYKVGRVESMEFDPTDRQAHYVIFIDAPYHQLVNSSTRFWDVSGISLSAGADGLKVSTGSIDTILLGGMTFGVPEGIAPGDSVEHNTEFRLYASLRELAENPFKYGIHYVVSFAQSVKGLLPGAPVEYRGITIGRVERVMVKESVATNLEAGSTGNPIPVLIYLEPGRLELPDRPDSIQLMRDNVKNGVAKGMRASLETGNLLTGAKLITVSYFDDVETEEIGTFLDYPTIPTVETGLGQLEHKLNAIMTKVNNLPLGEIAANANDAIASLNESLRGLTGIIESEGLQEFPAQLDRTMRDLQQTLSGLSPGSAAYESLNSSLLRLNRTLGNLETMSDTLAEKPNTIIFSSDTKPDPVPETKE